MKKIFKGMGIICGAFLLTMSTLWASPTSEVMYNHKVESNVDKNLLLFVPEDTTYDELKTIHNSNIQEFPDKDIIVIKESSDIQWSDKTYQTISLQSNGIETNIVNIENQKIPMADTASIEKMLEEEQISHEIKAICIFHTWNETLVGSPYKRYSKNINGWCYKMYQDIIRICRTCDKTDELAREVSTHYHNWIYGDDLGNYNYSCDNCGMRKE